MGKNRISIVLALILSGCGAGLESPSPTLTTQGTAVLVSDSSAYGGNTISSAVTMTLTNTGDGPATLGTLGTMSAFGSNWSSGPRCVSPQAMLVSYTGTCVTGAVIQPGGTCTIILTVDTSCTQVCDAQSTCSNSGMTIPYSDGHKNQQVMGPSASAITFACVSGSVLDDLNTQASFCK